MSIIVYITYTAVYVYNYINNRYTVCTGETVEMMISIRRGGNKLEWIFNLSTKNGISVL